MNRLQRLWADFFSYPFRGIRVPGSSFIASGLGDMRAQPKRPGSFVFPQDGGRLECSFASRCPVPIIACV